MSFSLFFVLLEIISADNLEFFIAPAVKQLCGEKLKHKDYQQERIDEEQKRSWKFRYEVLQQSLLEETFLMIRVLLRKVGKRGWKDHDHKAQW